MATKEATGWAISVLKWTDSRSVTINYLFLAFLFLIVITNAYFFFGCENNWSFIGAVGATFTIAAFHIVFLSFQITSFLKGLDLPYYVTEGRVIFCSFTVMHEGDPNEFAAKKNEPTVKRLNGLASQLIIAYVLMVVGTSMWAVFGLTCV